MARLRSFRRERYDALGLGQDRLFELMEAVLIAPERRPLVRLSLCPWFRRGWSSACDALADGSLAVPAMRALVRASAPQPAPGERPLWAVDGTHPLDVQPRGPTAEAPTRVAIQQIARARASQAAGTPRPVVALGSAHEVGQLARAHVDVDPVVRLAKTRVFRRAPQPYAGRGRPHTHGPVVELHDASTPGPADRSASLEHPVYGTVTVQAWAGLHVQDAPTAPFSVVRVQVEHPPHLGQPMPPGLAWIGGELPTDLHQVWRWYLRRCCAEHASRFAEQHLGWTPARPRSPIAADRWTRRVAAGFWQLWLARPVVAEHRLPRERPRPAQRLGPGRGQRAFGGLLLSLGTPAREPQPRGKSPGRRPGQCPEPAPRFVVARRPRSNAA